MFNFLKKPYPFNDDLRYNAKVIFFISAGILGVLLLLQPLDIMLFTNKQFFYLAAGVAVSTFITLTLNLIVLPVFFPKIFNQNKWNIWKEIVWNLWLLLTISSSNFIIYTKLFNVIDINFYVIGKIIFFGFFPVAALITINYNRLLRSHLRSALRLNQKLKEKDQNKEKLIIFESNNKKDGFAIKADSLLFVRSSDNYNEVFYNEKGLVKNKLIRSTLIKTEKILEGYDFIFKCHRTFIININHIKEIKGSSQGYKLFFNDVEFPILVSKKYINDFKNII